VILAKGKTDRQIQKRKLEVEQAEEGNQSLKKKPDKQTFQEIAREERVNSNSNC